ncbi:phospholipase A2 phaiodactylipin [Diachasma alloeum]|uniref:phospholipase A2 phaiodactylipin n=1 Tax=Diachasma alloeum TaxID=454923 RepID=UPI00073846CB|nr:phospholipase A2 phaiodactylipin [Diachasma alloeum]XP_015121006.1 phospholipase A2 phaiodactylipin [Diachasma alloeum]XP_015121015.1 phospholipase A2 phaiodactylipin [Diachasma alloeum]XP_015121023.1 phospholipase A2 phaiodactylipin [Diachasma alloeum]
MGFIIVLHVIFFAMCGVTSTEPLLSRNTYKGLKGIVPSAEISTTGLRRAVYYHDQAVAVIDVNGRNEIQNCDIIEVYEPEEQMEVLANLSDIARPTEVSFSDMTGLMYRCQTVDRMKDDISGDKNQAKSSVDPVNVFSGNPFYLLFGIVPGTKWCGTGDIAQDYQDLGPNSAVDRCCRTHDLCPVKVRAHRTRYNITNSSAYSKSHCDCDHAFYNCLKSVGTSTANIMGKIYFNIVKVGCVEDLPKSVNLKLSTNQMRRFASAKLSF